VDLRAFRDEFPVLTAKTYLISASLGPISRRSETALRAYVDAWAEHGAPEPVWLEHFFPRMGTVKRLFGGLIGADRAEIAITVNVSLALSSVVSALDLRERPRLVLSELDFPSNGHVLLAQRRRGAEVVVVRSPDGISVPVEAYEEAIDARTALVVVNRVAYRSGALVDAGAICRLAREAGALSFVDDFHGAGVVPVDVHALGCDLYAAGALKWLCGGPGTAFVYARREILPRLEPGVTGWFATEEPFAFDLEGASYHPGARRLEHGTPAVPSVYLAHGGLEIVSEVGPGRIRARQRELTTRVVDRADALGLEVRTPRDPDARGGTVSVRVGPGAQDLAAALYERGVCVDARGDVLRIAPHFFNTEDEVDRCFDVLGRLR
jgi:kynureninase